MINKEVRDNRGREKLLWRSFQLLYISLKGLPLFFTVLISSLISFVIPCSVFFWEKYMQNILWLLGWLFKTTTKVENVCISGSFQWLELPFSVAAKSGNIPNWWKSSANYFNYQCHYIKTNLFMNTRRLYELSIGKRRMEVNILKASSISPSSSKWI